MHSEDFGMAEASSTATVAVEKATRQSSLYFKTGILGSSKLELGYLVSSTEKIGEEYYYVENDDVYKDEIEFKDTQALKAKLTLQGLGLFGQEQPASRIPTPAQGYHRWSGGRAGYSTIGSFISQLRIAVALHPIFKTLQR